MAEIPGLAPGGGAGDRGVEGGKAWGGPVGLARIYRTTAWSRRCSVDAGRIKTRTRGPWVLRPEESVQKHPEAFSGPASWLPGNQHPVPRWQAASVTGTPLATTANAPRTSVRSLASRVCSAFLGRAARPALHT